MRLFNSKLVFYKILAKDCFAFEEYLYEMLNEGWVLERILIGMLFFRRTENKNQKYKITFDDIKNPTETFEVRNKKYEELGYNFIGVYDAISVHIIDSRKNQFDSLNSNKERLSNDKTFFENISHHTLKGKLINIILFIIICLTNCYNSFQYNNIQLITNNSSIAVIFLIIFLLLANIMSYCTLLVWKIVALRRIDKGKEVPYSSLNNLKKRNRVSNIFKLILFFVILEIALISKDIYLLVGMFMMIGFCIILTLIYNLIKINEKNNKRKINKGLEVAIILFATLIVTFSILAIYDEREKKLVVYTNGYPIKIEDLGYESAGKKEPFLNTYESESILAKSVTYIEEAKNEDESFSYTLMESDYEWLVDYIAEKNLNNDYFRGYKAINVKLPDDITVYKNDLDHFIFVSRAKMINIFKPDIDLGDDEFTSLIYNKVFKE